MVMNVVGGISVISGNRCLTIPDMSRQTDITLVLFCQIVTVAHATKESTQTPSGETQVLFH